MDLLPELEWSLGAARETLKLVVSFDFPALERDYELVCLKHDNEYPLNLGRVVSSSGLDIPLEQYEEHFQERHMPQSTALHSVMLPDEKHYLVGPLARVNLCFDQLTPTARREAEACGVAWPSSNNFQSIVARAVDSEMRRAGVDHVWLDATGISAERLEERFPAILEGCREKGVDARVARIPVVPAAHYMCGGVITDLEGRTTVPGLYACGEVACTGVHGANRLASNSLPEALVFAERAAQSALRREVGRPQQVTPFAAGESKRPFESVSVRHDWLALRKLMWDDGRCDQHVGSQDQHG